MNHFLIGDYNALIEAFNSRFRDEYMNLHWFASLEETRATIEA